MASNAVTLGRQESGADKTKPMIFLGIDPGLRATGFGVISSSADKLHYISSGVIRAPSDLPMGDRLKVIFESIVEIISRYQPTEAAIEKVFVNVNPQSTLLLGQARGVALCAIATCQVSSAEYTALQIKQAVVGHGHAEKQQVQEMIQRMLSLESVPPSDAADALACAICHAFHHANPISAQRKNYRYKRGRILES